MAPSENGVSLLSAKSKSADNSPLIFGFPLKYVSLLVLAIQNATLTIVMHYSRVSSVATYSAASAVLLNEIFKGSISFSVAVYGRRGRPSDRLKEVWREVFSQDCWKLSIPAILYVIQNNLQYTAISNLSAATFQVTYQMKILTTAFFSVVMLHKPLSRTKWLSLLLLAVGVGVVQVQTGSGKSMRSHGMSPLKGFGAVLAACMTSGLAGVYFEMVLKNTKTDLWVRNVQLSLFSLVPSLVPIIFADPADTVYASLYERLFHDFGPWAWATVGIQVFGGLITAVVIKYSDNIMKGFATSLAIVISFVSSVILFGFPITPAFLAGSGTVLWATWIYNQPEVSRQESLPNIPLFNGPHHDAKEKKWTPEGSPMYHKP
ncbi:nucleotide-sugar transporter [Sistotremastrum niveocremeum HHB9708]|uniref:Nucleotide-sugar transporter n=2 Tax=Sistotremastraceae TaxID=3402574 RepID=A0A164S2Q0_9AGAM|nr:nucleotide-sugar transporter [Sistotremastrum niveocremeum HHB9708]KZT40895.1 nucleotide-sugar transporter [Sistotremastrum suecicum HHB10207 ss-3]